MVVRMDAERVVVDFASEDDPAVAFRPARPAAETGSLTTLEGIMKRCVRLRRAVAAITLTGVTVVGFGFMHVGPPDPGYTGGLGQLVQQHADTTLANGSDPGDSYFA
jgi:hypothetical protein